MRKVPKLRFKEFNDEWEKKKLKNIFIEISERNINDENLELLSVSINNGVQKRSEIDTKDNSSENKSNYKKVNVNDIVYNTMRMWQGAVGVSNYNGIVSPAYTIARLNISADINYFKYLFKTSNMIYLFKKFSQGLTSDTWNLKFEKFREIEIFIPSLLKEQQKISNFLFSVDKKISLTEEKLELFREYKKGVMQKIFSQELRFKNSEGNDYPEWEEKRLGDYLIKYDETTIKNNQYPVLTSSRKGIFLQKDYFAGQDIASEDTTGYNIVPRGYFTYRHMSDDLIFKFNINNIVDKGIVSTLYPVFTTKNINDYFLKMKLNEGIEFKRYSLLQKQGGSRTYMYFSKLLELKLQLPVLEEQEKIADFLSAIDSKIENIEKELEGLKEFKKGLLQQMFV